MRRGLRLVVAGAPAAIASASLAWSATIRELDVSRDHDTYVLTAETYLEATPSEIFEVLMDYDRFDRISSVYKEHGYLEPDDDGTPIIYTRMEGCLLFYCKSMRRVERLEAERPTHIRTVTLPEQSDFKYSTSEWTLKREGTGTRMTYELVMVPDFDVPPLIGPWVLKHTLKQGGAHAIDRIERLAQNVSADAVPSTARERRVSSGGTSTAGTRRSPSGGTSTAGARRSPSADLEAHAAR